MKNISQVWFTLIEFMVAITIFFLISLIAYAPYTYNINKQKVRHTGKEVSQLIYEAKNMAINWMISSDNDINNTKNMSIAVKFDSSNKSKVTILWYPHDTYNYSNPWESLYVLDLQPWMQFDSFNNNQTGGMLIFESITWSGKVYVNWSELSSLPDKIPLMFSFKGSDKITMQSEILYYPKNQIVDY